MNTNYNRACNEVLEGLKYIDKEMRESIPADVFGKLVQNVDKEYHFIYDQNKKFYEQDFLPETNNLIAYLYYNFWTTTEEKKKFKEKMLKKELDDRKHITINPIFKTNKKIGKENNEMITVQKTKWYEKLLRWFKNFCKNNK